jgi:hypothetical protein
MNRRIPSQQRATILSFDSLMSSGGGVVTQPALGRAADVWGYPTSFVLAGVLYACSVPSFIIRARRETTTADLEVETTPPDPAASAPAQGQEDMTSQSLKLRSGGA